MMQLSYIKIFVDWDKATRKLKDAEKGRLIDALIAYAKGDGEAEAALTGNEAYVYPMFQSQIDRDKKELESLSTVRSESGKKGGRPRKAKEADGFCEKQKNQMLFSKSKKSKEEEKEEDEEEEKKEKAAKAAKKKSPAADAFACVIALYRENMTEAYTTADTMRDIADWCEIAGCELVETAIRHVAQNYGKKPWGYVKRPLLEWHELGLKTAADVTAHLAAKKGGTGFDADHRSAAYEPALSGFKTMPLE